MRTRALVDWQPVRPRWSQRRTLALVILASAALWAVLAFLLGAFEA